VCKVGDDTIIIHRSFGDSLGVGGETEDLKECVVVGYYVLYPCWLSSASAVQVGPRAKHGNPRVATAQPEGASG
jgi:hypothetical protein